jgi:hypothetical protein
MATVSKLQNITFYKSQTDFLLNNPGGPVGRSLARRGRKVLAAARGQVGVDTGNLKKSLRMTHERSARGQFVRVGSKLNHALVHHQGSRPHMITPKRSQVMVFSKGTQIIYATSVRHPGTRANRYLTDNLYLALKD